MNKLEYRAFCKFQFCKSLYVIFFSFLLWGCVSQKEVVNVKPAIMENPIEVKPNIAPFHFYNRGGIIHQSQLNDAGLLRPSSLREIAGRLTDEERNQVEEIRIDNGENINSLKGAELFPSLKTLLIYKSQIKSLNDITDEHNKFKTLYIESKELEDISNIVLFESIGSLGFLNSNKLEYFPDITHLKTLSSLSLPGCTKINFNELADKLPLGIRTIELNDCNIKSLNEISNLFNKCTHINLSLNLINEIDFASDFGTLTYVYMSRCPIAEKYFNWDDQYTDKFPGRVRVNGVVFEFGIYVENDWD